MRLFPGFHTTLVIVTLLAFGCGDNGGSKDAASEAGDALDDGHLDVAADPTIEADDPTTETGDPAEEPPSCSPRLFILVDSSASMLDTTPSRWDAVRDALDGFLGSPDAEWIEFGLGHFPTDDNCAVEDLVVHPLPEASRASVATFFTSTPEGNTPLVAALEFLATDTTANLHEDGTHNAIVLITDGWECCIIDCMARCEGSTDMMTCITECQAEIETDAAVRLAAAATTLRDTNGVRTFVIGISDEVIDAQLSAIAGSGGTTDGAWVSATGALAIQRALEDIAGELKSCLPIEP